VFIEYIMPVMTYLVGPYLAGLYLAKAKIGIWPIRAEICPRFTEKKEF